MGALIYYNGTISIGVGSQHGVNDLQFDQVDGSVYQLKEMDLAYNFANDTANVWYALWLSVLRDGRASLNPFTEAFPADIIGSTIKIQSSDPYGTTPLETPNQGYIADDPYFASAVRFGVSGNTNVAGSSITVNFRATAERVKLTPAISDLMYGRSYT